MNIDKMLGDIIDAKAEVNKAMEQTAIASQKEEEAYRARAVAQAKLDKAYGVLRAWIEDSAK